LDNPVVCTAGLARRLVRDEVRNCKLATLAQHFACTTAPNHRALSDARATVEVFYGLLERAGSFGVLTLEDLIGFSRAGSAPLFASRRKLADGLPNAPGVYAFRSASGEVLYVGKATDLRSRVRNYFGNDDRRKIVAMMKETDRLDHRVCATPLEAAVREVRLIAKHQPRFNRRSKHPQRQMYLRLTRERFPRLSVVKAPPSDGSAWLGPLASRRAAEQVAEAIHDVVPIRRCTPRIGASTRFAPCALAAMGRCLSPCDGSVDPEAYAVVVADVAEAFGGNPTTIAAALQRRMTQLAQAGRYEEAAAARDRLRALLAAVERTVRLSSTVAAGRVVASRPAGSGQELVELRHGRLVRATLVPDEALASRVATLLSALPAAATEAPAAVTPDRAEEVEVLSRWLHGDGVVLHHADGGLASPAAGGRRLHELAARLRRVHRSTGRPAAELAAKRRRRDAVASQPRSSSEAVASEPRSSSEAVASEPRSSSEAVASDT
jgi:DNA polymerase-3 subunit epsilon